MAMHIATDLTFSRTLTYVLSWAYDHRYLFTFFRLNLAYDSYFLLNFLASSGDGAFLVAIFIS